MNKLRVGVIGVGIIGAMHAQVYAESPLCELVALAEPLPARAAEMGARFGVRTYSDYNAMLASEQLDVVSVANRDVDHAAAAVAVARAGVHLLLEKPIAPTLAAADAIIAAIEQAGVKSMINFTLRFDPTYIDAYERIQQGEIGQVMTMFGRRIGTVLGAQYYGPWTDILISTGIHELDAMCWYSGSRVKHVYGEAAKGVHQGIRGDDGYMVLLRFANGAIGNLETSWLLPTTYAPGLGSRFDIVGQRGGIFIENVNERIAICTEQKFYHPDVAYWPVQRGQAVGALRNSLTHFLTCIHTNQQPIVGVHEGREALRLVLAIQESCQTGKVVYLAEGV